MAEEKYQVKRDVPFRNAAADYLYLSHPCPRDWEETFRELAYPTTLVESTFSSSFDRNPYTDPDQKNVCPDYS